MATRWKYSFKYSGECINCDINVGYIVERYEFEHPNKITVYDADRMAACYLYLRKYESGMNLTQEFCSYDDIDYYDIKIHNEFLNVFRNAIADIYILQLQLQNKIMWMRIKEPESKYLKEQIEYIESLQSEYKKIVAGYKELNMEYMEKCKTKLI